jgi:hypothetical protein
MEVTWVEPINCTDYDYCTESACCYCVFISACETKISGQLSTKCYKNFKKQV